MNGHPEETIRWVTKADHDLGTALITYLHIPDFRDTITFHCQQSVEKYLKAFLVFHEVEFKFTHDLIYLLELIAQLDDFLNVYFERILKLQNYAVEIRYPDETIFLTNERVIESITTSQAVRKIILDKLNIRIEYNDIIDRQIISE